MKYFFRLRYISLIAVVSSFLGALLMAFMGMDHTLRAAIYYFSPAMAVVSHRHQDGLNHHELTTLMIIEGIDAFLFSLVLIVFAYGVYYLFIGSGKVHRGFNVPSWMKVTQISELKTTLSQVIIVIIFVKFLADIIESKSTDMSWNVLILPASVLCLAGSLRLMHYKKHDAEASSVHATETAVSERQRLPSD
jgi:uncharacterized membrane protein YqhA